MKGCSPQNAAQELERIRERYGDRCAICTPVSFRDTRGRIDPNRKTPVADAKNIVKVIMVLPGEQAARVRTKPEPRLHRTKPANATETSVQIAHLSAFMIPGVAGMPGGDSRPSRNPGGRRIFRHIFHALWLG